MQQTDRSFFDKADSLLGLLPNLNLDHRDTRYMLAKLYLAVVAHGPAEGPFENIFEDELEKQAAVWYELICGSAAKWSRDRSDPNYFLDLFSLIRALDHLCHEMPRARVNDPGNWFEERSGSHIIPRVRSRDDLSPRGQGMRRRLLRHHRVLPSTLNGKKVELISYAQGAFDTDPPRAMGAALFRGLSLAPPLSGSSFVIEEIAGPDLKASIDLQLAASYRERCFVTVWPELTIDPPHREHIQGRLEEFSSAGNLTLPQIVVAGSCHEEIDGVWYNRAAIYDGYGSGEYFYYKMSPYIRRRDGCKENIASGSTWPIFITDHYSVGVAICRDLADFNRTEDLVALELDLLVVPSMGGKSTMDSHETSANLLKAKNDTRVFVVQINDALKENEMLGWVLPTPSSPVASRKVQNEEWLSYASDIK
jgi:hypothetical protein